MLVIHHPVATSSTWPHQVASLATALTSSIPQDLADKRPHLSKHFADILAEVPRERPTKRRKLNLNYSDEVTPVPLESVLDLVLGTVRAMRQIDAMHGGRPATTFWFMFLQGLSSVAMPTSHILYVTGWVLQMRARVDLTP